MIRNLIATVVFMGGAIAFGTSWSLAQDTGQSLMKSNGRNIGGVLSPMAKGDKPYDQAAVDGALAQLDDTAKKLPGVYPDSAKGVKGSGDFSPSAKIWDDRPGFNAAVASFAKAVTDAKGKVKDVDTLKASLPSIGKECASCHETFRVRN